MYNITFFHSIKRISLFIIVCLISSLGILHAQTVNVTVPTGGFQIDGNLESNTPTIGVGDWVQRSPGAGGFVLNNNGTPVNSNYTSLVRDVFGTNADNSFTGGSKFNDNPNTWVWANSSATGKGDINNAMYHLGKDGSNNEWIFVGSDRAATTGTSYIDFSFLQNTLTTTPGFGFSSAGPDGGRTVNDILLTVEYGSGGSVATVYFYLWKNVGGNNFDYVLQTTSTLDAFAQTNGAAVNVPFGSFGTNTYTERQYVEAAVNLTSVFGSLPDPCIGVSIKTLFIKTKNSTAPSAALNDFVEPIQVQFSFGTATIAYADSPVCKNSGPIMVTRTGVSGGTYSSSPGLSINPNTGEINVQNSNIGTYTVTYSYTTSGCNKTATTTVVINGNPDAPIGHDITECEESPIQTLNANDGISNTLAATLQSSNQISSESITTSNNAFLAPDTIVWYDQAVGGNVVNPPIWNQVGSITYYAEAVSGTTGCRSITRTPVKLTILPKPLVDDPADVTACDSYTLPALTNGNYFTGSGGTGTPLFAGDAITSTQTIYVYAETGTTPNCSAENSFLVTINDTPIVDDPADVTACDSYTLPALTNGNYFTGSGGTGTPLFAGNSITSTQTIYVYAETGTTPNCSAENSFLVTINDTPIVDDPADVTACDSYTLPALTNGNYFTGSGGTGTPLFAGEQHHLNADHLCVCETGTTPNCSAENSFLVTINDTHG